MKSVDKGRIRLYMFDRLAGAAGLYHAVTTRTGGFSPHPYAGLNLGLNTGDSAENVFRNHAALARSLHFDVLRIASSRQVHGTRIMHVTRPPSRQPPGRMAYSHDGFDALITSLTGITLMVRVADCVPVLLFDPVRRALAVIHAGWKGTLAGITAGTLAEMSSSCGSQPGDIIAGIGPSIGPCCFCVGRETADLFYRRVPWSDSVISERSGMAHIDLREANRLQLVSGGCRSGNIDMCDICTSCRSDIFFSHRREQGKTGRFVLLAGLRALSDST